MSANLSNWRESSHSKWSFQNIDKVLSTQVVKKSTAASSPLKTTLQQFDTFKLQKADGQTLDMAGWLADSETDGIVILHRGNIVYEDYFNGNSPTAKHILMSMTKSVTGLVAGILSGQGKLDLNAPIKQYVPEASKIFNNVTVQQCLDMRSGIRFNDDSHAYRAATGWEPLAEDDKERNLHDFLSQVDAETDGPGSMTIYVSANTDLVGWALERASGKTLATLISELIWQPMGADSDAVMSVDPEGNARAAGGLCATVRDVARLGQVVLEGGRGIVPASWIEDMLQNGDHEAWQQSLLSGLFKGQLESLTYRSCWITSKEARLIAAMGINGQHLFVDLDSEIVMAKTSSQTNPFDPVQVNGALSAFQQIKQVLLSKGA